MAETLVKADTLLSASTVLQNSTGILRNDDKRRKWVRLFSPLIEKVQEVVRRQSRFLTNGHTVPALLAPKPISVREGTPPYRSSPPPVPPRRTPWGSKYTMATVHSPALASGTMDVNSGGGVDEAANETHFCPADSRILRGYDVYRTDKPFFVGLAELWLYSHVAIYTMKVVNVLGSMFAAISSTASYSNDFAALKIHTRIVHQPRENVKYRCSLCVACFNTQGNLLRHFLSVHQELRRFICGLCGSRYSQNQVLRRHLLQVHQVQMDSISSFDKKSVSEVYVLPSTSQIPISSTVAAKIRDIAKEEKQKFTGVKEFLKTCLGISNRRQNETCAEADTQKGVAQVQTEEVTQVNKTCQTVDTQNYDTEELTTIQLPATNFALNTELSCSIETQTNKLEESLCSSHTTGEGSVSRTLINEPSILTSEIFDIGTMFNNLEGLAEPINNDIMSCEFCFRDKDSLTEHSVPILLVNNDILDTSQESVIGSQLESDNEGMDLSAQSQGSIVPNDVNMQFISVSGAHNTSFTEPVTDKNTMSPPTITDWRYYKEFVEHKRIHDGITPYECKDCGRKFRQRRVFVRHKEGHSLDKKHKCPVCNKAFSRLDVLKLTHMKTHFDHPPELQLCTLHKKVFHEKKKRDKDQKPVSNNIATEEEPMVTLTDIDLQEVNFLCDDERYNTVTYLIPEMLEIM
uniref:C2H2-type domain-containing protein n=1 Tax=Timema bartmani TaxID=61472 RepID=A0A7R9I479_9NEOP|nr:unnamed protein product [Timema bartmani]